MLLESSNIAKVCNTHLVNIITRCIGDNAFYYSLYKTHAMTMSKKKTPLFYLPTRLHIHRHSQGKHGLSNGNCLFSTHQEMAVALRRQRCKFSPEDENRLLVLFFAPVHLKRGDAQLVVLREITVHAILLTMLLQLSQ